MNLVPLFRWAGIGNVNSVVENRGASGPLPPPLHKKKKIISSVDTYPVTCPKLVESIQVFSLYYPWFYKNFIELYSDLFVCCKEAGVKESGVMVLPASGQGVQPD